MANSFFFADKTRYVRHDTRTFHVLGLLDVGEEFVDGGREVPAAVLDQLLERLRRTQLQLHGLRA